MDAQVSRVFSMAQEASRATTTMTEYMASLVWTTILHVHTPHLQMQSKT